MESNTLLKSRGFVALWAGSAVSELGGAFGTFCNSVLVYELTGSKMALGSMWLLYFIPSILLQLVSGPFIDKWSRKWIMVFSQWTRAVIFLMPLAILSLGMIEVWHIYVVQVVIGLITPLYVPASQAITPTIVAQEQLPSANAFLDGTTRLMLFSAPILGGIFIESIGVRPTLTIVCILLTASGFTLLCVNEKRTAKVIRKTWIAQFQEGIQYFFRQRTIVWLGFFLAFVQFGVGVTMVINLPYITDVLKGNYQEYGLFMAGFPLGYVIGSFIVGKLPIISRRKLMLGSLVIGGCTFIALGVTQTILLAILFEILAGVVMAIFSIHNLSICQQLIPNQLMGSVMSVRLAIIRTAMPLGILTSGILSELWGIRPLYIMIGAIIVAFSIIGITVPYFKFIDKPTKMLAE
ncbi:MFS transporter [Sporosarcina sp. ACRSL]|uniref:MFS transporter n=1 Tax=Sporosarcina sp. ACRSL TaxID=2918215 RepID=UPI001EF4A201|nr:MFS transporter [Sporosarcina sp. ACRSL]MCG7343226.1 MFS transporter [Sporosarcina sp. ACRSL]